MKLIAAAALLALATGASAGTLTVHTSQFLAGPTAFTGFETMRGGTSFSEAGITIDYVGYVSDIWLTSQAAEGLQSWYPNGGGFGYTRITFDTAVDRFQFAAGSGWQEGTPSLQYQVLLGGDIIGEGAIAGLSNFTGFSVYGFSDAMFDEVRLQAQATFPSQFRSLGDTPTPGFDPGAFDGLTLDALALGGDMNAIPEPATWAMLITGFGFVGAALRRRSASAGAATRSAA
jgi:hypothetical protein